MKYNKSWGDEGRGGCWGVQERRGFVVNLVVAKITQ